MAKHEGESVPEEFRVFLIMQFRPSTVFAAILSTFERPLYFPLIEFIFHSVTAKSK